MKNYKKLNLDNFCVKEIENVESQTIFGGDWIASIGATVGNAWCETKGAWNSFHEAGSSAVSTYRESGGK